MNDNKPILKNSTYIIIQTMGMFLGFFIGFFLISNNWIHSFLVAILANLILIIIYLFTGRLLISGWKKR